MPSEFDTFAANFVAPALQEQFGERGEQGKLATLVVHEPNRNQPVELVGVMIGNLKANDLDEDIDGTRTKEKVTSIVELTIPLIGDNQGYQPVVGSRCKLPGYSEEFVFEEVLSEGDGFATVRTERKQIASIRQTNSERS